MAGGGPFGELGRIVFVGVLDDGVEDINKAAACLFHIDCQIEFPSLKQRGVEAIIRRTEASAIPFFRWNEASAFGKNTFQPQNNSGKSMPPNFTRSKIKSSPLI